MTEHNRKFQPPKPKDFLGRLIGGYKFSNAGFKRLFILGLFCVPMIACGAAYHEAVLKYGHDIGTFWDDFTQSTIILLIAYLLIVRVVRWVYDGFASSEAPKPPPKEEER